LKDIEVRVIDNDIEKAIRILKKKIQNDGLFKRLKLKKSYEKPSEHRRRKMREALRRERLAAARAARYHRRIKGKPGKKRFLPGFLYPCRQKKPIIAV
jgi:small subunit ribosomal protein S21